MKKTTRIILVVLLVIVVVGVGGYLYVFHKPHRDISSEDAAFRLKSVELMKDYESSQSDADSLYLDKAIQVSGRVVEMDSSSIKLEGGVFCNIKAGVIIERISEGSEVNLKGRVVGYDELFGELRMDNCELVQ